MPLKRLLAVLLVATALAPATAYAQTRALADGRDWQRSTMEERRAYLIGDENLSWKAYLERFFAAAGRPIDLPVSTDEHPLFPDIILYAGRNATIAYEPDNGELGYSRGHLSVTIEALVRAYS